MKVALILSWAFIAFTAIVGLDNIFLQPHMPGWFVGGSDLTIACGLTLILLDKAYHVFDVK